MLETIAVVTSVVDVLLIGIGGLVLRHVIRVEIRLTRIETKLNLNIIS